MKKYFFIILLMIANTSTQAKSAKSLLRKGKHLVTKENYITAIPVLEEALITDTTNDEVKFNLGVCYLNRYNRVKGRYLIEQSMKKKGFGVDKYAEYWYARSLQLNYKFEEAIPHYEAYKDKVTSKKDSRRLEVSHHIQECKDGAELMQTSSDFDVYNLGNAINSKYSEHSAVVTNDNKTILFTSRKSPANGGKITSNGEYWEDIYTSTNTDNTWSASAPVDLLNTSGHDAVTHIFGKNNDQALLYRSTNNGDIYYSRKVNDSWTKPTIVKGVNTSMFESSAYMSKDGKKIYFASNYYTKAGDLDLYYSELQSDSTWSKGKPLSIVLNTPYDEDAIVMANNEKTIFFSSRGHNTMGGFDIFRSDYDETTKEWSIPVNLGYPINTPDEDAYYYTVTNGKKGFLTSHRDGGLGEKDIYGVTTIPQVIASGRVFDEKSKLPVTDKGLSLVFKPTDVRNNDKNKASGLDSNQYQTKLRAKRTYDVFFVKANDTIDKKILSIAMTDIENSSVKKNYTIQYYKTDSAAQNAIAENNRRLADTLTLEDTVRIEVAKADSILTQYGVVYFNTNEYKMTEDGKDEMLTIVGMLHKYKNVKLTISGYTDDTGPNHYNLMLSKKRAKSVTDYLIEQGADPKRIEYKFYGSGNPVIVHDQKGKKEPQNRRVEVRSVK